MSPTVFYPECVEEGCLVGWTPQSHCSVRRTRQQVALGAVYAQAPHRVCVCGQHALLYTWV